MKFVLLFIALLSFSGCALPNAAQSDSNVNAANVNRTVSVSNGANPNTPSSVVDMSATVDKAERAKLEDQSERFRQKTTEFKDIDFQNFSFPYKYYGEKKTSTFSFKNKDEYEYDFRQHRGWFSFADEFYVDLTGDNQKEAIIILWNVSCGGSCNGGAGLFYVYEMQNSRPKLLWQFETGSLAYGLGLKSFRVKDKLIIVEQFGKCPPASPSTPSDCNNKFGAKNIVQSTFAFDGKRINLKENKTIQTSAMNVMNYDSEISIDN